MPEINVDEIVAKIREEIARQKKILASSSPRLYPEMINENGRDTSFDSSLIRSTISNAELYVDVGAEVTPMVRFKGLTRKIALAAGKGIIYMSSFITDRQRCFNRHIIYVVKTISDNLFRLVNEVRENHNKILHDIRAIRYQLETLEGELKTIRSQKADYENLSRITEQLEEIKERKIDVHSLNEIKGELEAMRNGKADVHSLNEIIRQMRDHRLNILDQQRRLAILINEARKRLPEPISYDQIRHMLTEEDHLLDAMFISFEDQFRGTREEIKEKQKIYLPYIRQVKAGTHDAPVLDLGCGRGEWLELLKENGYVAKGVDINRVIIEQCKELTLDVQEADVIEYLRKQSSHTFGAITGFHIVEHLPLKTLIALIDESLRVLKPEGIVIFETPNPENIIVGACNFYFDPTHRNPIPPKLLIFLLEARGFLKTKVMKLHPYNFFQNDLHVLDGNKELMSLFTTEQDYSVMAFKA